MSSWAERSGAEAPLREHLLFRTIPRHILAEWAESSRPHSNRAWRRRPPARGSLPLCSLACREPAGSGMTTDNPNPITRLALDADAAALTAALLALDADADARVLLLSGDWSAAGASLRESADDDPMLRVPGLHVMPVQVAKA